jgi:hypothetical protein
MEPSIKWVGGVKLTTYVGLIPMLVMAGAVCYALRTGKVVSGAHNLPAEVNCGILCVTSKR